MLHPALIELVKLLAAAAVDEALRAQGGDDEAKGSEKYLKGNNSKCPNSNKL